MGDLDREIHENGMSAKERKGAAARRSTSRSKPAAAGDADLAMDYEYMELDSQSAEYEQGWMETPAAKAMGKSAAKAIALVVDRGHRAGADLPAPCRRCCRRRAAAR